MSNRIEISPEARPLDQLGSSSEEFAWQTVQVTYIVPFFANVDEVVNELGAWTKCDLKKDEDSDGRTKGRLSETVEAQRKSVKGAPNPISRHFLGAPIRRALGRVVPESFNSVLREEWTASEHFLPQKVRAWSAERLRFTIGESTRKLLVITVDIEPDSDIESVLVTSRAGKRGDLGALKQILAQIQPEIKLRGDSGIHTESAKVHDDLASRFLVSTVTVAVPGGPGNPPPIRFLEGYENWGTTPEQKWSYFLATHQGHNKHLPPDAESVAKGGFLNNAGAYDVRVEPLGTSIIFTDSIPDAWWDQLQILNSRANPFVDLAILHYWQHACLEYFTNELAKQAHPANAEQEDLKVSLEALRKFGDDYFYFRNCIWFDSVPNQPKWTEYLRKLQETHGDREALTRLAADYKDWTSHLGNRVALKEEERRDLNESQVRAYSTLVGLGGLLLAVAAIVLEPASSLAWYVGIGLLTTISLGAIGIWRHFKKSRRTARLST